LVRVRVRVGGRVRVRGRVRVSVMLYSYRRSRFRVLLCGGEERKSQNNACNDVVVRW
jgi:hypothetical protein